MLGNLNLATIQMDMYNAIIDTKMDIAAKLGKIAPMTAEINQNGMDNSVKKSGFDVDTFLENSISKVSYWGSGIVILLGLIMVIVGIWQLFKGLSSGGKSQVNWVIVVLLIFIGGALAFTGGWNLVKKISGGGAGTLESMGSGK